MSLHKSRKGSIPFSLDRMSGLARALKTLKKKASDPMWAAFIDELEKISVSEEEAIDAAKMLSESKRSRTKRYVQSAGVGAVATPLVSVAGDVAKAVAGPKGQRMTAVKGVLREGFSRPELAKQVTRGIAGGGALQALRENVQLHQAKKTYSDFLREHGA